MKILDNDTIRSVFENVRNLIVCALVIAAGLYENENSSGLIGWLALSQALGWGLVVVGVLLMLANLLVGLSQLSTLAFPRLSMTLLCCLYVLASVRLVVVLAAFRSSH